AGARLKRQRARGKKRSQRRSDRRRVRQKGRLHQDHSAQNGGRPAHAPEPDPYKNADAEKKREEAALGERGLNGRIGRPGRFKPHPLDRRKSSEKNQDERGQAVLDPPGHGGRLERPVEFISDQKGHRRIDRQHVGDELGMRKRKEKDDEHGPDDEEGSDRVALHQRRAPRQPRPSDARQKNRPRQKTRGQNRKKKIERLRPVMDVRQVALNMFVHEKKLREKGM